MTAMSSPYPRCVVGSRRTAARIVIAVPFALASALACTPISASAGSDPMAAASLRLDASVTVLLAFALLLIAALGAGLGWLLGRRGAIGDGDMGRRPGATGVPEPPVPSPSHLPAASPLAEAEWTSPQLDLIEQPVLVLAADAGRWILLRANAAALELAPGVQPGGAALPWLETMVPGLVSALPRPGSAVGAGELGPWRWCAVPLTGMGSPEPGLWLVKAGSGDDADQFSFTVSHDLRAPVRVVEGFARIVKEDYGNQLDRVANDHLDRVLGAAARMNSMIDALMALAKLSARPLQRQPVSLSQLAGFVVEDLRRQQPERSVQWMIEPGLDVQGDPTLLRLVLENLLGNAWKYSARNPQARIEFARTEHDGRACFVVRDNGAGFDMRGAERLFGLFQRLHSAGDFPGHGVGLASVRRIVQRHGGHVWAESETGLGARFYFTLGR